MAALDQRAVDIFYVLLQSPVGWAGPEPSDNKQRLYGSIAEELSRRLIDLASRRIRTEASRNGGARSMNPATAFPSDAPS